jgi:hypothetical protein
MAQMLQHAKGGALALLSKRAALWGGAGRTPRYRPIPVSMPCLFLRQHYLFFASDATHGRLSYVAGKGMNEASASLKPRPNAARTNWRSSRTYTAIN